MNIHYIVGTVNNTEHKVTMKTLPIWTYQFSITLTSDRHDLTLSIIDLLILSDRRSDAIIIVSQNLFRRSFCCKFKPELSVLNMCVA